MTTDISAVLTVKSGLDPHMIIELEDDSKLMILLMVIYVKQDHMFNRNMENHPEK